jgi:EAL and modified HD-GYP domain-containing signal transduction protein
VNGLVTLLPTSTVLEIVETVVGCDDVLEACARYKSMGYKLALDDFQMHDGMEGLIALADYIKVDFSLSDAAERQKILSALNGRKVTLLAEKIETEEEFDAAQAEGFTLFQGYFFCHPTVFSKKRLPTNGANYMYLLSALVGGEFHVGQIAILLQSEVALSYQLLRMVNSAAFDFSKEVHSLRDALVLVGERKFRVLLLNAIATETCRSRPNELLVHVLHRARFLELIAAHTHEDAMEQYLFGLLSLMDVMLGVPVNELIEALPLRKELKKALCGESNSLSRGLRLFESYEDADWEHCMNESFALRLTESDLTGIYRDSLVWSENCVHAKERKLSMTV